MPRRLAAVPRRSAVVPLDRARRRALAPDPASPHPRQRLVRRTTAALRLEHPELRRAPTLQELLAVCRRLSVHVSRPVLEPTLLGAAAPSFNGWAIVLVNQALDEEAATAVLLHELGHALLHVRDPQRNARRIRQLDAWPVEQLHLAPVVRQEEAEAHLFAALFFGGDAYAAVLARVAPNREHVYADVA